MLLESPEVAFVEDQLTATTIASQHTTPVDVRPRKESVAAPMPEIDDILLTRWRIQAYAGFGTANVVFRGEHVEMRTPVAIKIVNRVQHPERSFVIGHLRNEAQVLRLLCHPNVARLWDFSEDGPYPCLVTGFIDGATLKQKIQQEGRLEPRHALRIAIHLAEVLVDIARSGIVHRDIKPENVVLSEDGSAKLIDFGLAIVQGMESPAAHGDRSATPRVGTVAYLAPEQARSSTAIDGRADIYSLGATLYHAVTGRLPFNGNSAAQMILRHLEDKPVPPRAIVPHLDDYLSDVIVRMMAKNPRDRFNSPRELLEVLDDVRTSMPR